MKLGSVERSGQPSACKRLKHAAGELTKAERKGDEQEADARRAEIRALSPAAGVEDSTKGMKRVIKRQCK